MKVLINNGASVDIMNSDHHTPLYLAVYYGNVTAINGLIASEISFFIYIKETKGRKEKERKGKERKEKKRKEKKRKEKKRKEKKRKEKKRKEKRKEKKKRKETSCRIEAFFS